MADAMVLATQKWLNEKYGNDSRFNKVAEEEVWRVFLELTQGIGHKLRVHQKVAKAVDIRS